MTKKRHSSSTPFTGVLSTIEEWAARLSYTPPPSFAPAHAYEDQTLFTATGPSDRVKLRRASRRARRK